MRFRRRSADSWELCDIHPLFGSLLEELPQAAGRHKKAQGRLYPDPNPAEADDALRRDWKDHVRPGLEQLFASSREIVQRDVAALGQNGQGTHLTIPSGHLDAWLNALNQARLIIVEENAFTDVDLDHREPPDLATRRGLDLLKVHFYAHLQELLVEAAG
ncbi:MAG: DUF2017 family protein [Chthoniobacterales bacterium]|jgi:hypothetical protein